MRTFLTLTLSVICALLVTIVSINLVGDRLRDILNPRLASHYGV